MKTIINKFNRPDSILVVTSYPSRGNNVTDRTAVAWHSKRMLRELAKQGNHIIVLAEKTGNAAVDDGIARDGKNIIVLRTWKKGSIVSMAQIAKAALKFDQVHKMLFQFEFNVFGGIVPVAGIPMLLSFLRLIGKTITFELHQVINDISRISNHINVKNIYTLKGLNIALHLFYKAVGAISKHIVVFESQLKQQLSEYIDPSKINVVPLAVTSTKTLTKTHARKVLGISKKDFVIVSFGFVNWYKGSDWITKTISRTKSRNIKLLLAGGESSTLKDKKYYQKFYKDTIRIATKSNKILHTDFIPEKYINRYFAASDVVVFPYRVFMSSSGPLTHALMHQKPVLFSTNLQHYFQNDDVRAALQKSGLKFTDIMFDLDSRHFMNRIKHVRTNPDQFAEFSRLLGQSRLISDVAKRYTRILTSTPPTLFPLFKMLFTEK